MRNIYELNPWLFRELLHGGKYAVRVESEEDIQELAKHLGYSYAQYYCDYNNYRVYELLYDQPRMYPVSPEMLFIQYKYARLDTEGEIREIQDSVYDMELPEKTTPFRRKALTEEVISLRDKAGAVLGAIRDRLRLRSKYEQESDDDQEWFLDGA